MSDEIKFWTTHLEVLKARAICPEYAWACGLRSWSGAEAIKKLKDYGIDPRERFPGLPLYRHGTGIEIPYIIEAADRVGRCRIRLDETSVEVSAEDVATRSHGTKVVELPRYVAQAGVPVTIYRPPLVRLTDGGEMVPWSQVARDTSISLFVTEAPLKALSLSDHGMPAIGLGGVLAGPHVTASSLNDWGDVDPRSLGSALRPAPDLLSIDCRGRTVCVVFDANLAFRPMVALGAARLAFLLEGLGAQVRIVRVPLRTVHDLRDQTVDQALVGKGDQDQGPDDFIYLNGVEAFQALVAEAGPASPIEIARVTTEGLEPRSDARRGTLGRLLEDLYFRAYLRVRGDAYVSTQVAAAMRPSFKVSEIRAVVKEFSDHLAEHARNEMANNGPQFSVRNGKIFAGDADVADFTAKIDEEIISDDGTDRKRIYRVSGELTTGGGLPTVDVDADEFHKMEWVADRWGARATMRNRRWGLVAEGIQRLSDPKVSTKYTHFGWRTLNGERAFLMPGGAITKAGWIDADVEAPERLARYQIVKPPESQDEREEALFASLDVLNVAPDHVSVPGLLSVFLAPLVDMLGPTFVLWLHGHSGAAKSTFASLLQLHYGDFTYKNLPETWVSTANALETTLWRAKDVVLTIDNFVPPQSGRDQQESISKAVKLIQSYGDGTSRGRLDSEANERTPRPPRCMPIVTAEILPPENVSTLGRIFVVGVEKYDLKKHDETKAKAALLQKAFAGWIQFLTFFEVPVFRRVFETKRKTVLDTYAPILGGAHPRLPETLALFLTAKEFLFAYYRWCTGLEQNDEMPGPEHPLTVRVLEGLAEAAKRQPTFTAVGSGIEELGDDAHRKAPAITQWLGVLRTVLRTGAYGLAHGQHGLFTAPEHLEQGERWTPKIGWRVDDEVWLLPEAANDAVKQHLGGRWTWGEREFQTQLRPFLKESEGKALSVKKTTSIGRVRVWVLDLKIVLGEVAAIEDLDLASDAV